MTSRYTTLSIGITGNIGSGKTEVTRIFVSLGAKALYADDIAKEIIASDAGVRRKIQKEFGDVFLPDGRLDRQRMAALVFSDSSKKEKLDAIVHPPTLRRIDYELRAEKKSGTYPLVAVEAALLFESGAENMLDYIIVVETEEANAIERVMRRDGVDRSKVEERLRSQLPAPEKKELADFTIRNSGDLATLEQNCRFMFSLLTTIAAGTQAL